MDSLLIDDILIDDDSVDSSDLLSSSEKNGEGLLYKLSSRACFIFFSQSYLLWYRSKYILSGVLFSFYL